MESVVYTADIFENLKKETLDISKAGCLEIRITDHPQNIWMYKQMMRYFGGLAYPMIPRAKVELSAARGSLNHGSSISVPSISTLFGTLEPETNQAVKAT